MRHRGLGLTPLAFGRQHDVDPPPGWTPIGTALAFLPGGVMVAVLSVGSNRLVDRFGTARLAAVAFACLAAAYVVFLRAGVTPDYPGVMLPTMLLVGLAFGLGFAALSVAATAYRPALFLITGVAAAGALVAVSGLRPGARRVPLPALCD